jgi:hypothetical protein
MRRQRKVVGVGSGARRQLSMAASGASLLPRIATSPQQGMQGNWRSHRRLSDISSRILCRAEQLSPSPRVDAGSSSRRTRAPLPGGPCRSPTYAPRAILVADLAATGFTVMRTGLEHVEAFTKLIIRNKPQTTLDAESAVAEEDSTRSGDSETNSVPSRFLGCVQAQSGEVESPLPETAVFYSSIVGWHPEPDSIASSRSGRSPLRSGNSTHPSIGESAPVQRKLTGFLDGHGMFKRMSNWTRA